MVNKLVYRNLVNLRNASNAKRKFVDLFYNNLFLCFLDFFYKSNFIIGYVFNDLKKVRIFLLYYKDKGLLDGLLVCNFLKKSFSFKALKYLRYSFYRENFLYLFSTSFGFLTLNDIFLNNYHIGGILYFYIVYR